MTTLPFNYPGNETSGLVQLFQLVNDYTQGYLGVAIIIIVAFVSFLSTKDYSTDRAFGFASFLTLITSLFLRFLNLINDMVFFITILLFILSAIYLMRERNVEAFGV